MLELFGHLLYPFHIVLLTRLIMKCFANGACVHAMYGLPQLTNYNNTTDLGNYIFSIPSEIFMLARHKLMSNPVF